MKLLELFIDVTVRGNKAVSGLSQIQGRADRAEKSMNGLGRGAFSAVGHFATLAGGAYSIGRAIGATIRAGAEFEKQMNGVNAIAKGMGATNEQLTGLQEKARELGRSTPFSATQSAAALEMLLKNGVSVENILNGMADASLTLAAAMGKDIAPTADFLTDVMAQFGLEAKDATNAIDVIAGASVASKFDMDDLAQAFSKAGAQANSVGIDLEEYAAIISMVSSNFTSGELAGTAFRGFLTKLSGVSGPARKRMKELGLEFFNTQGQLKEFPDIITELNDGLGDLSDEARTKAIAEIFGLETMPFVNALLGKTGEELENVKDQIDAVSAEDLKNEKWKGLSAAFVQMKSALESLMITVSGSGFIEWLEKGTRYLTELIRSIEAWITANPELMKQIKKIAEAMAPWVGSLVGVMLTLGTVRLAMGLFFKSTLARMGLWVVAMVAKVALLVAELAGLSTLMGATGMGGAKSQKPGAAKGGVARNAGKGAIAVGALVPPQAKAAMAAMAGYVVVAQKAVEDRKSTTAGDDFLANKYEYRGSVRVPNALMQNRMTDAEMRAHGAMTQMPPPQITNNLEITVHAETNANPGDIANAVGEEMDRRLNGAMLEANN